MATNDELDRLLKAVPEEPLQNPSPLDEGRLLAWQQGRLGEADAAAVERRLASDPEARALLRELSRATAASEVDDVLGAIGQRPKVVPLRRRAMLVAGAVTAMAAGLAVVLSRPQPLPRYHLEVEGGLAETRSDTATGAVLRPDSRLVLRLRAPVPTDAKAAFGLYRETVGGRLERVRGGALAARGGSFEFVIEGRQLLATPGRHRVWVHLARDEAELETAEGTVASPGEHWWLLDTELRAP
jgi:ferric-dicitrate binding protein FerR (iron transport regulator)